MITTSGGGGQHAALAAAATAFMLIALADRTSLRASAAIIYLNQYGAGRVASGSQTHNLPIFGLDGADAMTSVSEGSDVTETALSSALATVTTARKGLRRDITDQIRSIDPTGALNLSMLAQDGIASANSTLTQLIAALGSGFSRSVGTSGTTFSHDTFLAAKAKLIEALVPGPYMCILSPYHFADWMTDLEARGGLTQWRPAAADMQILRGPGFQGTYDGVDIYTTAAVPSSGSDKVGCMFGRGAIGFAEQEIVYGPDANIVLAAGPIAVEAERNALGAVTRVITHYNVGVCEIEDARGVKIIALP